MKHLKRQAMPKTWPLSRKGTTFVAGGSMKEFGLPLLVVIRDLLKVAKTRREVKKALHSRLILVNDKPAIDEKMSLVLMDTLSLTPSKKYYKLMLNEKGKFNLEEIKESESSTKISKIEDKKILKKNKIQLNLLDGRNYLVDKSFKCKTGDSVVVDFKSKKIVKCVRMEDNSNVFVFKGKHSGKQGVIKNINEENKMIEVEVKNSESKEKINVLESYLMITEK